MAAQSAPHIETIPVPMLEGKLRSANRLHTMQTMRGLVTAAIDVLFPPQCAACAAFTDCPGFCDQCLQRIHFVASPMCTICGLPFAGGAADHTCPICSRRRRRFDRARACVHYERGSSTETGPFLRVLHDYKYRRDVTVAPVLADLLITRCPFSIDHDVIVPVPLFRDRLRWRGFNQAHLLAQRLGRRHGVPVSPFALVRARPTPPQVGLDERHRRRNVAGAFIVPSPSRLSRKRTLLVDDVYTTGATVEECARVLKRAGVAQVDVLVLARAT